MLTSNEDRLRFESFSGCCGVHARLDLLPDALDEGPRASGTTNVDFNHVRSRFPAAGRRASVRSRALCAGMTLVAELTGPDALRFVRGIPRRGAACLAGPQRLAELSPPLRFARGFSGEGALLESLADVGLTADAELMSVLPAWSPRIDIRHLSAEANHSPERTVLALTRLAASGRVGYDLAEQSFFHRELPFGPAVEKLHPAWPTHAISVWPGRG